jgi:hypothetical protein
VCALRAGGGRASGPGFPKAGAAIRTCGKIFSLWNNSVEHPSLAPCALSARLGMYESRISGPHYPGLMSATGGSCHKSRIGGFGF